MEKTRELSKEIIKDDFLGDLHFSIPMDFKDINRFFTSQFDDYSKWIKDRFKEIFFKESLQKKIKSNKIEWVTIHYKTLHYKLSWNLKEDWIQIGIPFTNSLMIHEKDLQVYQGTFPPYFNYALSSKINSEILPFQINLGKEQSEYNPDYGLFISKSLAECVKNHTNDLNISEGYFSDEKVIEFEKIDSSGISIIKDIYSILLIKQDLSKGEALGLFRDSCRLTFKGLKKYPTIFKYPRNILLCPIYIEGNIIGSMAFIGPEIQDLSGQKLFHSISDTILKTIRLLEEPYRESRIHELETLNQAKNQFVHLLGHSIRDPLENIINEMESILNYKQERKLQLKRKIKKIVHFINHLLETVNEMMLTFAKENIEDYFHPKKKEINAHEFTDLLRFITKASFEKKSIKLVIGKIPRNWVFFADYDLMIEVMMNLLNNAMRYAKNKVNINVEKDKKKSKYKFKISDDGLGINPQILPKLFNSYISDYYEKEDNKLHGFGLFLSKKIMKKQDGDLYLNNKFKFGAQFIVEVNIPQNNLE